MVHRGAENGGDRCGLGVRVQLHPADDFNPGAEGPEVESSSAGEDGEGPHTIPEASVSRAMTAITLSALASPDTKLQCPPHWPASSNGLE